MVLHHPIAAHDPALDERAAGHLCRKSAEVPELSHSPLHAPAAGLSTTCLSAAPELRPGQLPAGLSHGKQLFTGESNTLQRRMRERPLFTALSPLLLVTLDQALQRSAQ